MWAGEGAEKEEDTESEAGSRLWAVSTEPDAGLELMNCEIMTWAEVGSLTDWATQAPPISFFKRSVWVLNGICKLSTLKIGMDGEKLTKEYVLANN